MSLLRRFIPGIPRIRPPQREFYRLTIVTKGNDAHACLVFVPDDEAEPVILQNEHAFEMPASPHFTLDNERVISFRDSAEPLYEAHPAPDLEEGDFEIPVALHGKRIPAVRRSDTEIQAWMDGNA